MPVIHIAGRPFDKLQHCDRCGAVLADWRSAEVRGKGIQMAETAAHPPAKEPWPEGSDVIWSDGRGGDPVSCIVTVRDNRVGSDDGDAA